MSSSIASGGEAGRGGGGITIGTGSMNRFGSRMCQFGRPDGRTSGILPSCDGPAIG